MQHTAGTGSLLHPTQIAVLRHLSCDFRRHPQSEAVLMRFALVFSELELLEHRALIMATPDFLMYLINV